MKFGPDKQWWEANTPTLLAAARATKRGGAVLGQAALVALRPIGRVLGRPAVLGAGYLLVVTAAASSGKIINDMERALGRDISHIEAWIQVRFARTILAFAGSLALTAIVLGAGLGALAGAALKLRRSALGRPPLRARYFLPASLALTAALHAAITLRAIAWYPQSYSDAFYDAGGWRASFQVFLTDELGARAVSWIALAAIVVVLAPPPSSWGALARSAVARLRRLRYSLVAAACVSVSAGVLVAGRPGPVGPRALSSPPNVLILAADSFRDEGLSPRVMPRLSALAGRGVRFSRAYVSMARTLSSWTTFLTGRYAHHHGIRSMFPRWEEHDRDLDTLPGRLSRAGYRSAVVSDYVGDAFKTIDLGFQRVIAPRLDAREIIRSQGFGRAWPLMPFLRTSLGRRVFPAVREMRDCADADMLADEAIGELRELHDSPFFLTVFFGASHTPYAAPAPYYRRFTDASYSLRNKYHKSHWILPDERTTPEEVAHIRGLYEGALASVDDGAGRILDELDRLGLRESTIVVVLGDHGENLADAPGRYYGHGSHLFGDHDLRVPLIVVDPRRQGGRVEPGVVTNADLAPTLYQLTGVEPSRDMDGESLVPALDGTPVRPRPTFAETELWIGLQPDVPDELRFPTPEFMEFFEVDAAHGDTLVLRPEFKQITLVARHRMVRDGAFKLLYIPTAKGVIYKLFDTEKDPENLTDLAAARPEIASRLESLLWTWMLGDTAMEKRRGYLVPKGISIPQIDRDAP